MLNKTHSVIYHHRPKNTKTRFSCDGAYIVQEQGLFSLIFRYFPQNVLSNISRFWKKRKKENKETKKKKKRKRQPDNHSAKITAELSKVPRGITRPKTKINSPIFQNLELVSSIIVRLFNY